MKKHRFLKPWLAILLTLALCAACLPAAASETPEASASAGEISDAEPVIVREDISKRGVYEKHFERSDGSYIAALYAEPVHYMREDGTFEQIDNTLVEATEDGRPVLKNQSGLLDVSFSQTPQEEIGSIRYGGYTLRWEMYAKADPAEKELTSGEEAAAEPAVSSAAFTGRTVLQAADLLDPEVFDPDGTLRLREQTFTLDAAAVATAGVCDPLPADGHSGALAVRGITSTVEYAAALPGISLAYTLRPTGVKEEIILQAPSVITSYRTRIEAAGLTPALQSDQSVEFSTPDGEVIFTVPAPFMVDAAGAYSKEIVVCLTRLDADICELVYIPDYAWLHDDARAYPVIVDPSYEATPTMYGSDKTQDTYVYSGSPNSNYYSSAYLKVGRNYQSYVRFPTLPDIGSNYIIYNARLQLAAVSEAPVIRLCRVTGSWSSSTLTWNNQPGAEAFLNLAASGQFYNTYDVTEVVSGWYSGKYPNYGFMIQDPGWSDVTLWNLYSSDCGNSNVMPGLQVCYYPMSNRNISTGAYFIRNRGTGKYLTMMGGIATNHSNVGVTDFTGELAQQWYVENHGNGVYSLRSNGNRSYYLDVDGAQDVNERNVQIYANSNQRFRLRWYINTVYTSITPDFSNTKSLDVYGGSDASRYNTNVQIYSYTHSSNQFWEFEKVNYGCAWEFKSKNNWQAGAPNCFGYALGLKKSPPLSMSYGESVSSVASRVMNYVQNTLGRSIRQISGPTASINSNEYRFCMRVGSHANKMDYHFWLQTNTGAWTDKHGTTAVSDEPANPSTANWDLGGYTNFYDSDTIYFAATLH